MNDCWVERKEICIRNFGLFHVVPIVPRREESTEFLIRSMESGSSECNRPHLSRLIVSLLRYCCCQSVDHRHQPNNHRRRNT